MTWSPSTSEAWRMFMIWQAAELICCTSRSSLRTMMPLGVLLMMVSEKLWAFWVRNGRHMFRSALPWYTAMAFSRQVL